MRTDDFNRVRPCFCFVAAAIEMMPFLFYQMSSLWKFNQVFQLSLKNGQNTCTDLRKSKSILGMAFPRVKAERHSGKAEQRRNAISLRQAITE